MSSLGTAYAVALKGLEGQKVEVQTSITRGLPGLSIIGLPDASLREAKERIRAAMLLSGTSLPNKKLTVNLLPASLPKQGSTFDLAIALSILNASGVVSGLEKVAFCAELGLDGRLKPTPGCFAAVVAAQKLGFSYVVTSVEDYENTCQVPGVKHIPMGSLQEVVALVNSDFVFTAPPRDTQKTEAFTADMSEVVGNEKAKKAIEIAATGRHHLLLSGPPGQGKTMLAERLPSILPPLSIEEQMEVFSIQSLVGDNKTLLTDAVPYEHPHHSSSMTAVIGGGRKLLLPGAISRAHKGVLLLDEAPEFHRNVLEALREPLENREICIARASGTVTYPADFQLVLTANPCPCGAEGMSTSQCMCSPNRLIKYREKISKPLLDRVDIKCEVNENHLAYEPQSLSSSDYRNRVLNARQLQQERLRPHGLKFNSEIPSKLLQDELKIPSQILKPALSEHVNRTLTTRGLYKVQKLAFTIADLAQSEVSSEHVEQALELGRYS